MDRLRAHEWGALLLDPGSAEEHLTDAVSADPLGWPGYAEARAQAAGEEAVRVWTGTLAGHAVVLAAFDFAHFGGSMGGGVGARVAGAFDLAGDRRLPIVTVTATGGSRMQEGMVSLAQMAHTTVAAQAHAAAGLLHVGVAADPTTGGVYASFQSQADLLVAEPGAYVGFAGPRVVAALAGGDLPDDVNRAEWAAERGLVDAVVPRERLRPWIANLLTGLTLRRCVDLTWRGQVKSTHHRRGWEAVEAARDPARPRASAYVDHLGHVTALRGDRAGGVDPGTICALGQLSGRPLGVVGLERHPVRPAGYRTAWRLLDLASRLGLPVLTLIDTPGADPRAEGDGLAHAISDTLARLLAVPTPTVALVIGEGGSGGAFALAAADRVLIEQSAIFSVIRPEGAAAILLRDASRAPDIAARMRLTADDLVDLGIADEAVPDALEGALAAAAAHLDALGAEDTASRLERRARRWRGIGGL